MAPDPVFEYFRDDCQVSSSNYAMVTCRFCEKAQVRNATKCKTHLLSCTNLSDKVAEVHEKVNNWLNHKLKTGPSSRVRPRALSRDGSPDASSGTKKAKTMLD